MKVDETMAVNEHWGSVRSSRLMSGDVIEVRGGLDGGFLTMPDGTTRALQWNRTFRVYEVQGRGRYGVFNYKRERAILHARLDSVHILQSGWEYAWL
jgi:hypothetical protein